MTPAKNLFSYRQSLLELKQYLASELKVHKEVPSAASLGVNDSEDKVSLEEGRELADAQQSAESRRLIAVDQALERLNKGRYGICESCGQAIPAARLKAMPDASLCVDCKSAEEERAA
jgi:RNA polymerase-binding protein DksA